jgi:hypothetical protein
LYPVGLVVFGLLLFVVEFRDRLPVFVAVEIAEVPSVVGVVPEIDRVFKHALDMLRLEITPVAVAEAQTVEVVAQLGEADRLRGEAFEHAHGRLHLGLVLAEGEA